MRYFILPTVLLLASCSSDHGPQHWSYSGATGPDHWGELNADWRVASTGAEQSPIDLIDAQPAELESLSFHYQSFPLDMVNNGHTIQVNASGDNWLMIGEERYDLQQFHFHTPSEHTVNGRHSAMEVHLVHSNAAGELAVVGVMLDAGSSNPLLARFWDHIPSTADGTWHDANMRINALGLLPVARTSYRYAGSLTTPPCSEGVRWIVMQNHTQASTSQIEAFSSLFGATNRPVQRLYDRRISLVE